MGNVLELKRVEEPVLIKEMVKSLSKLMKTEDIKSKQKGVLIYNKLPQYLWNAWGEDLRRLNITWQDFLRLLSKNSEVIVDWAVNETITWDELINELRRIILSYGKELTERKSTTLDKYIKKAP